MLQMNSLSGSFGRTSVLCKSYPTPSTKVTGLSVISVSISESFFFSAASIPNQYLRNYPLQQRYQS